MKRSLVIAGLAISVAVCASAVLGLRWNASGSLPPGLYLERASQPEHGDLVLVCLPEAVGRWARGRGYLGGGRCPGGAAG